MPAGRPPRRIRTLLVCLLAGLGLAALPGCRGDAERTAARASTDPTALRGARLDVGSKDFDEQLVLGQIAIATLRAAGATVVDKTRFESTDGVRKALLDGEVDLYWEYTGTGWMNHLGHGRGVHPAARQLAAVRRQDARRNDVAWIAPAPLNNTYALAMREPDAARLGVRTVSDVARLVREGAPEARFCIESEFAERRDGFPGLQRAYGFRVRDDAVRTLDTGLVYARLGAGRDCAVGEVFSTDGLIRRYRLRVLRDDRAFFPVYQAAVTVDGRVLRRYPAIERVLRPVARRLSTEVITGLNARVSGGGEDPAAVARDWLRREGFISGR